MAKRGFVEDMGKLASSVFGNMAGARTEFSAQAKQRLEQLAMRLDLVTRDEFDALQAMIAKARLKQEELDSRLAAVESKLGITVKDKMVGDDENSTRTRRKASRKSAAKTRRTTR